MVAPQLIRSWSNGLNCMARPSIWSPSPSRAFVMAWVPQVFAGAPLWPSTRDSIEIACDDRIWHTLSTPVSVSDDSPFVAIRINDETNAPSVELDGQLIVSVIAAGALLCHLGCRLEKGWIEDVAHPTDKQTFHPCLD